MNKHRLFPLLFFILLVTTLIAQKPAFTLDSLKDQLDLTERKADRFSLLMQMGQTALELDLKLESLAYYQQAYRLAQSRKKPLAEIQSLLEVVHLFRRTDNYDSCFVYGTQAIELGQTLLKDYPPGLARANLEMGTYYYKIADYDSYLTYSQKAKALSEQNDLFQLAIRANQAIGYAYFLKGYYEKSLQAYLEAAKRLEQQGLPQINLYLGIAEILIQSQKYDQAIEYIHTTWAQIDTLKDPYNASLALWYLADAHEKKGAYLIALQYATRSIAINQNRFKRNFSYAHLVASRASMALQRSSAAEDHVQQAYDRAMTEREPNRVLMAHLENQFGQVYQQQQKFDLAIQHFNRSRAITEKSGYRKLTSESLRQLSAIYEAQGQDDVALAYYRQHIAIKDSLFNVEKSRQTIELQTQYETEKVDLENRNLKEKNTLISNRNNWYLGGAILLSGLLLILGFFFYQNDKIKNQLAEKNKTIAEQNEQLKELDQVKSRFFSNITHEFRTPLTLIIEPVRQLIARYPDTPISKRLKLVQHNSQHLLLLVNQLLDLSKLESGKMELDFRRADIMEVIQPIYQSFLVLAEQKNIRLKLKPPAAAVKGYFDTGKLEKIIFNVLSNAIKYTPTGQVEVFLSQNHAKDQREQPADQLLITISDTGTGIPADQLDRIFDRFYQVDDSSTRKGEGTGIGLALTRELVELMEGEIEVESEVNQGTVFRIKIPIIAEGEVNNAAKEQGGLTDVFSESRTVFDPPQKANTDSSLPLVILIEDNAELRSFIHQSIEEHYQVVEASNGLTGLEKAKNLIPDLVISDIMMPEKDGYDVCEALKNDTLTAHIPIILLTAKSAIDSKIKGLRTGAGCLPD